MPVFVNSHGRINKILITLVVAMFYNSNPLVVSDVKADDFFMEVLSPRCGTCTFHQKKKLLPEGGPGSVPRKCPKRPNCLWRSDLCPPREAREEQDCSLEGFELRRGNPPRRPTSRLARQQPGGARVPHTKSQIHRVNGRALDYQVRSRVRDPFRSLYRCLRLSRKAKNESRSLTVRLSRPLSRLGT